MKINKQRKASKGIKDVIAAMRPTKTKIIAKPSKIIPPIKRTVKNTSADDNK